MKLNPITIIPFNDTLDVYENNIIGDKKDTVIYVDSKDNLQIFNKEEILKNKNIEKIDYIKTEDNIVIIYKYKKDYQYKIIIDGKEYNINKLFNFYYKNKTMYKENINWKKIIENELTINEFIDICCEYLDF